MLQVELQSIANLVSKDYQADQSSEKVKEKPRSETTLALEETQISQLYDLYNFFIEYKLPHLARQALLSVVRVSVGAINEQLNSSTPEAAGDILIRSLFTPSPNARIAQILLQTPSEELCPEEKELKIQLLETFAKVVANSSPEEAGNILFKCNSEFLISLKKEATTHWKTHKDDTLPNIFLAGISTQIDYRIEFLEKRAPNQIATFSNNVNSIIQPTLDLETAGSKILALASDFRSIDYFNELVLLKEANDMQTSDGSSLKEIQTTLDDTRGLLLNYAVANAKKFQPPLLAPEQAESILKVFAYFGYKPPIAEELATRNPTSNTPSYIDQAAALLPNLRKSLGL